MGKKQAAYDLTGAIVAFYDSVVSPAPNNTSVIDITDDQWQTCLAMPGYTVASGVLTAPTPLTAVEILATEKLAQSQVVDVACATAIVSGFTCDALTPGAPHTYPSKLTDQTNLLASVLSSLMTGLPSDWTAAFWCADETDVWGYRAHTAAQIQAVGVSYKTMVSGYIGKKIALDTAISAATTVEAVQAVVWS